ncbi:MAG: flavin reductase family protein [Sulfolobales archaeon]
MFFQKLRRVDLEDGERVLYPVIPTVVVAEYEGRIGGMMAAWWTQLSSKPFLVGVLIAPERYTYALITKSRIYSLNFLDSKYIDRTPYLGDVSERFFRDKIRRGGFTILRGEVLGAPILGEASASLEIELRRIVETGDHDLFIGEVKAVYAAEDFKGLWKLESYNPLMYLGRTRKPEQIKRIYAVCREYEIREIPFAPEPLREYAEKRISIINKVRGLYKEMKSRSREDILKAIAELLKEEGLDSEDAEFYYEEVRRSQA